MNPLDYTQNRLHLAGKNAALSMERASSVSLPEQPVRTTSQEEHILTGHTAGVLCFAMLEDRLLFSGSVDCTIKVGRKLCLAFTMC